MTVVLLLSMQGIVGYRHRSHGVGVKARPNHAASASVDLISLLLRDRLPRRAPVRQHGIQSNHLSLPWSPLPLRSPQVFVSRAAPNSKSRRSAGSSLLPRSVLKRPASSSTLSASTGSVCLFTSSSFYCFLSLALASRHVNCLLAQLQPCQIHLPSNTRLLLGQCAARGLLHSPIPLIPQPLPAGVLNWFSQFNEFWTKTKVVNLVYETRCEEKGSRR